MVEYCGRCKRRRVLKYRVREDIQLLGSAQPLEVRRVRGVLRRARREGRHCLQLRGRPGSAELERARSSAIAARPIKATVEKGAAGSICSTAAPIPHASVFVERRPGPWGTRENETPQDPWRQRLTLPMCNLYSLNKKRDAVARFFRVSHNRSAASSNRCQLSSRAMWRQSCGSPADDEREVVMISWGFMLRQPIPEAMPGCTNRSSTAIASRSSRTAALKLYSRSGYARIRGRVDT